MTTTAAIAAIGIVTRGRVASLLACLESYAANCRRHGRMVDFLVTDDSPGADDQTETKAALRGLAPQIGAPIRYAGWQERQRYADALARESHVPGETIRFALFGDGRSALSTGANRNSLLLDTVGTRALSVDDDTRCRIAAPPGAPGGDDTVAFSTEYDPTEFWFFPDHSSALDSVPEIDDDLLRGHEELLGSVIAPGDNPSADVRVAITLHGLLGDSGMASPRYYLGLAGRSRERLIASASAYAQAFRSREILRTVCRPTISSGPFCMSTFFGFDHRQLLPPFFPVERNADGVFGFLIQRCTEGGRTAFLPSILLHAPAAPRTYARDDVWTDVGNLRMAEVLMACVLSYDGRSAPSGTEARLRHLGRYLREIASLGPAGFEAHVRAVQQYRTTAFITLLESRLQAYGASPDFWASDVRRLIEQLANATGAADAVVPSDLRQQHGVEEARRRSPNLVARFGELLEAWPAIVAAAARLHASGCRLTETL